MSNTRNIKVGIFLGSLLGFVGILILYLLNSKAIIETYNNFEGALGVIGIIALRMGILLLMAIYMFHKWFKAEKQFLTVLKKK